jgi:hypothetical protein
MAIIGVVAVSAVALASWATIRSRDLGVVGSIGGPAPPAVVDVATEARIAAFCGDCHGVPKAGNYSRSAWRKEVMRGYEFYARSGRTDLDPPSMDLTIAYYERQADEEIIYPEPAQAETEFGAHFRVEKLSSGTPFTGTRGPDRLAHFPPAISDLRWTELKAGDQRVLLACDMRQGTVTALKFVAGKPEIQRLVRLHHPCHVEPCDLDGNGSIDLVVADMGGLAAVDFDLGRVVWLRNQGESGPYEPVVLAEGLGRISDVRPGDFDGDGDLDLVVGEFGARKGRILLLRNEPLDDGEPAFKVEEIDRRPGAIHLPPHDLNGDGRLDFLALVSQEFESVDAFVNQGQGRFRKQTLWEAGDPAFGSSGMELVDIDSDGDLDVLLTNGDSFDDKYIKPCHGVQWLENRGNLKYEYHRLADLPGTYHALAGDMDGDGDLDVIATVWIEPRVKFGNPAIKQWASLICLEQTAPGEFVRHTLETDFPWHATLEMADFDGDGDLDFALGSHSRTPTVQLPYWLAVWWNDTL